MGRPRRADVKKSVRARSRAEIVERVVHSKTECCEQGQEEEEARASAFREPEGQHGGGDTVLVAL